MKTLLTRLFVLAFVLGLALSVSSCKKCRECYAYDDYTQYYLIAYEEYCAKGPNASRDVDDWEDSFRDVYYGYYIVCQDVK